VFRQIQTEKFARYKNNIEVLYWIVFFKLSSPNIGV
jgi:hypothetical protein